MTPGLRSLALGFIPTPRTEGQKVQETILKGTELICKIFKAKACSWFLLASLAFHWDSVIPTGAGFTMHNNR